MDRFTGAERAFCVKNYYKNGDSYVVTRYLFSGHFQIHDINKCPTGTVIKSWIKKFEETGSTLNKNQRGRPRSKRTEENVARVYSSVRENPDLSTRQRAASLDLQISSTLRRILKRNHNGGEHSSSCSKPSNKKRKLDDDDSECDENESDIEDEHDLWAKECAIELRQMDPEQQVIAKRAISYILREGRLGKLTRNSVHINNQIPNDENIQNDPYIIKINPELNSIVVSQEIGASSGSSPSFVDTGSSSTVSSHRTAARPSHVKSELSNKTVTAFQQTATSVDAPSSHMTVGSSSSFGRRKPFNGPGSSSIKRSRKKAAQGDSTSVLVKLEPPDDIGLSSHEFTTAVDSSTLRVKSEPCDDIESTTIIASHVKALVRRSSHMTSEPNSPPLSPDFTTVVIKKEEE